MSSIITAEPVSEKQLHEKPTQQIYVETDFMQTLAEQGEFKLPTRSLNTTLTQSQLALKRKLLGSIQWKEIHSPNTIFWEYPLTFRTLKKYIPLHQMALYHSFKAVFDVQPSTNFLWQGLAAITFDPTGPKWYTGQLRPLQIHDHFQMNHAFIEAGNRKTTQLEVPLIFPFNYFVDNRRLGVESGIDYDYIDDYPLGTLRIVTLTPLQSMSGQTHINLNINISIENYSNGGNAMDHTSTVGV